MLSKLVSCTPSLPASEQLLVVLPAHTIAVEPLHELDDTGLDLGLDSSRRVCAKKPALKSLSFNEKSQTKGNDMQEIPTHSRRAPTGRP